MSTENLNEKSGFDSRHLHHPSLGKAELRMACHSYPSEAKGKDGVLRLVRRSFSEGGMPCQRLFIIRRIASYGKAVLHFPAGRRSIAPLPLRNMKRLRCRSVMKCSLRECGYVKQILSEFPV